MQDHTPTVASERDVSIEIPPGHASTRHKLGNPFAYFKKCLSLYADGKGRAGVAEYWSFTLVSVLAIAPFYALMLADPSIWSTTGSSEPEALFYVGFVGLVIVGLGLVIPSITVTIRRLHDLGFSGWLYLLSFVPFGSLFLFVCTLIPSSAKTNKHGPSPKADPGAIFA